MTKIDLSNKGFQFFLAGNTKVANLEEGAIKFGGATKIGNEVYSNIENGNFVEVTDKNVLKVFVPSTTDVNKSASSDIVKQNLDFAQKVFTKVIQGENLTITQTKGSWYSEDNKKVVVEDIYIVSIDVNEVTDIDIEILYKLAEKIKANMSQEGVSIMINQALAIV
jgi:hypothetical protein